MLKLVFWQKLVFASVPLTHGYCILFCQGYTRGGTQIQRFISAGINNFGYNSNVTLIHNTYVHVTVIATNTAELVGTSYSDPIHVDLTSPDILYVYDGRSSSKISDYTR